MQDVSTTFQTNWLNQHIADAETLGKPLLLEEFGKQVKAGTAETLASRDQYMQIIYNIIEQVI